MPAEPERGHRLFEGREAVLATKHDKLPLVAPPLAELLGLEVRSVEVDTDLLGTFSGEVPRPGSPWETAVQKARMAMHATGASIGIASEGSIGPSPACPWLIADAELVVLVDDVLGVVITGRHVSHDLATIAARVAPGDDLGDLLARADFPNHALIVRPADGPKGPIVKGIVDRDALTLAVRECAAASTDGCARVETDLRADRCPSRRPAITAAARSLAERASCLCASCGAPGWGVLRVLTGAPCRHCGTATDEPVSEVHGCGRCAAETMCAVAPENGADPAICPVCNP